jgi:hypothetical protein
MGTKKIHPIGVSEFAALVTSYEIFAESIKQQNKFWGKARPSGAEFRDHPNSLNMASLARSTGN